MEAKDIDRYAARLYASQAYSDPDYAHLPRDLRYDAAKLHWHEGDLHETVKEKFRAEIERPRKHKRWILEQAEDALPRLQASRRRYEEQIARIDHEIQFWNDLIDANTN